jgi:hypothetical protein
MLVFSPIIKGEDLLEQKTTSLLFIFNSLIVVTKKSRLLKATGIFYFSSNG